MGFIEISPLTILTEGNIMLFVKSGLAGNKFLDFFRRLQVNANPVVNLLFEDAQNTT